MDFLMDKLHFLSGSLSSTANSLGIQAANTNTLGQTILPAIQDFMVMICIIAAVGVICLVAFYLITAKRQEDRSEAMKRIMWVGIGLFIVGTASGIVGYIISLYK